MAQMLVEGGKPEANFKRAEAMLAQAAAKGCRVAVLPECMNLGWTHPSARDLAEPIPGAHFERLAAAAKAHGLFVAAGLVERAGDRRYNAAVLIGPGGEPLLHYRKINELDIAHDLYAIGDRLGVASTALGTFGLDICADNFHGSLAIGHVLARMGARVILSPSSWAMPADHDQAREPYHSFGTWMKGYTELARLYDAYVIGVSDVGWITEGPWKGRKCIGCSLAVGPDGTVLAEGPYGPEAEALLVIEIQPRPAPAQGTAMAEQLKARGYDGP
jgi:predicted amidohydrolase